MSEVYDEVATNLPYLTRVLGAFTYFERLSITFVRPAALNLVCGIFAQWPVHYAGF